MKRVYERPVFLIEEFAPNKVIAATCSADQTVGKPLCFIGTNTKSDNIITSDSSCGNKVMYKNVQKAYHVAGKANTNMINDTIYENSSAIGLLVWCVTEGNSSEPSKPGQNQSSSTTSPDVYDISMWDYNESVNRLEHTENHEDYRGVHCHVLPVYVEISVS